MASKWEHMTDWERGAFIRRHARGDKPLSPDGMMKLFALTEPGLVMILQGQPWRPEYASREERRTFRQAVAADFGMKE